MTTAPVDNYTASPSDDIALSASATCITFREFIQLANLSDIKLFMDAASSSSDGENLKALWACAFKEGLKVGHQLYVGAVRKLNEAHKEGYDEG